MGLYVKSVCNRCEKTHEYEANVYFSDRANPPYGWFVSKLNNAIYCSAKCQDEGDEKSVRDIAYLVFDERGYIANNECKASYFVGWLDAMRHFNVVGMTFNSKDDPAATKIVRERSRDNDV